MTRHRMVVLCLAAALALPAFGVSTAGLVAHWPLNGTGSDTSGNGNDLTVVNATPGADHLGTAGGAVELNPTSSLSLADGPATELTSQFTWAGWIRFDRIGTEDDNIVVKTCCGANATTMFYADTYAWDGSHPNYNQIRFFVAAGDGNFGFEHAGPILQNHAWYHLALVYDGPARTMKVYVNGALTNSLTYSGAGGIADVPSSLNNSAAPLVMGRLTTNEPSNSLQGALDDVWWFSRPLTAAEVAELAGVEDCSTQVQELQAQVASLSAQVSALTTANAALSQQLQTVTNEVATLENTLRTTFRNPQFTIPGSTPDGKVQTLIDAILALNRGQLDALYRNLGGH